MSLNIVYFHGYNSSPTSAKVMTLREALGVPVYAFPADIDPEVAIPLIEHNIDMMLLDNMHSDDTFLFVGTSLGGWMASKMAEKYNIPAIIINPSVTPSQTLQKYGVPEEICAKYDPLIVSPNNTYFFAEHDEVIDNTILRQLWAARGIEVYVDPEATHRFDGPPFQRVIDRIKKIFMKSPDLSVDLL